jgi:hypothetical protein
MINRTGQAKDRYRSQLLGVSHIKRGRSVAHQVSLGTGTRVLSSVG